MDKYIIKKGIYIVEGKKKSCIYDCNNNKHYWVDNEISSFFHRVIDGALSPADKDIIETTLELSLLEKTDHYIRQFWPDINELFRFPRHLDYAWIELTNKCNLKCIHCYNDTVRRNKQYLSYEDFVYIVDELVRLGIKSVQLIGGEPFLVKEDTLFKMLGYASCSFKEFEIFINGTLTNSDILKRIKNEFPNCKFALSLYSFIKEEYEKVTQIKGSYDKCISTLNNLKKMKIPFRYVGIYASGVNIGKEMDFGVPYRQDYIRLAGRGNMVHYNEKFLREKLITPDTFKFNDLIGTLKCIYSEFCFANYLYIGSDMNVYPCVMERRLSHGNLRNKAITEILDKQIINYSKDNVQACRDCEFRHLCKDCRPDSISMVVDDKPWYCTYDPYNAEWADVEIFIHNLLKGL